ncbi:Mediator of RNA polymerase II transcription subunit 27 [Tritrichomonas musculus]|uniref:Mediator of RNA polymerase II transcription subunit 27 n=1 Tax=Tritrichomonas musculus TaxID=1915356 RepID=A0ABR2KKL1_9EUKA
MNADREVVLEETLQECITQMKKDCWTEIEQLSTGALHSDFKKAQQDLNHAELLNNMLSTRHKLNPTTPNQKKCEDAVAFRHICSFFQSNTERFLRTNPCYTYDFDEINNEIANIVGPSNMIFNNEDFLPYICLKVSDYFVVKIIFSIDNQLAFVVVHSSSEVNRSPFEQSDFRVFRTLAVYFSRALPDFILKYHKRGLIEFIIWLKCYNDLFTTSCTKCDQIIERDLTGDLLPPIIRTVNTCYAYHMKCAPFEIELPDFGYVTLMSEDQMQEKTSHVMPPK